MVGCPLGGAQVVALAKDCLAASKKQAPRSNLVTEGLQFTYMPFEATKSRNASPVAPDCEIATFIASSANSLLASSSE